MSDHITEWLGAYHDGELRGPRLRQVEHHLSECAACRAELEGLQGLSTLLHDAPPAADFLSAERFAANLALSLPRQPEQAQPRKAVEIGWWLIPVGVLGVWLFLEITFSLSSLVLAISDAGLLGGGLSWLQGGAPQADWFIVANSLLGDQIGQPVQAALSILNDAGLLIENVTGQLFWQLALAVAYLGWLAAWWLRQHPAPQNSGDFSQS